MNENDLKTVESDKQDPWVKLRLKHERFLTHLECIMEMRELVIPVLESRDREREMRITELVETFNTERSTPESLESEQQSRTLQGDQNHGMEVGRGKSDALLAISNVREFLGHIRKIRQAEEMFRQSIISSTVSKFDEFIVAVLEESYRANPSWLKQGDRKISLKEVLEVNSLDELKKDIIAKEIDSLMRDSHCEQIAFLDAKLKLGIQEHFDRWKDFLEITERRNLFVHTGGKVSSVYLENCKKWAVNLSIEAKVNATLDADDEYIVATSDCFYELSMRVFQSVARRLYPEGLKSFDYYLNNRAADLLNDERWHLAEKMFEFALKIPPQLLGDDEMSYYYHINLCIALKFSGKDYKKKLYEINWKPLHPKYHFAVAVLEDRFDDATKLMRSEAVLSEVTESHFKDWPLLREFRKTDGFKNAFRDIFEKDYASQILQEARNALQAQQLGPDSSDAKVE